MEIIKSYVKRLDVKGDFARIIPLGDVHRGHRCAMLDKVQGYIDYVKKEPDTWIIIMGDMMENAILSSMQKYPGSQWEQIETPEEQLENSVKMLQPVADKILFMVDDNHSMRSWNQAQYSPAHELARRLHVKWMGLDALVTLIVGKNRYTFHATHGAGMAVSPLSVIQKIVTQAKVFPGADVYLRAHHHMKVVAMECVFDAVRGMARKVFYIGTGGFVGFVGSYVQRNGGKPHVPGVVKIKLYKGDRDVHVTA